MADVKQGDSVVVIGPRHSGHTGVVLNVANVRVPGVASWRVAKPIDVRLDSAPYDYELFGPEELSPRAALKEGEAR